MMGTCLANDCCPWDRRNFRSRCMFHSSVCLAFVALGVILALDVFDIFRILCGAFVWMLALLLGVFVAIGDLGPDTLVVGVL